MPSNKALEEALKERLGWRQLERSNRSVAGASCINSGLCYKYDGGGNKSASKCEDSDQFVFIKTNSTRWAPIMFQGELESLKQIRATGTVRAPKPVTVVSNYDSSQTAAIVMEYFELENLSQTAAIKLGEDLANLHDYNNKVIRYNERARKWIGGKPPSAARQLERLVEQQPREHDDDDDRINHETEDEKTQFSKHIMSVSTAMKASSSSSADTKRGDKGAENSNDGHDNNNDDGQVHFTERFVPLPGTEEEVNQFGFHVPTSCGLIPQVNEWTDDWVAFYARHRLDKSIRSLLSDHGDRELDLQWSHLQLKVDKFFSDLKRDDDKIVPALLHGDLWSGNVAQLTDGDTCQPVIYDPSSFYGHSEYDFGIARMFGGISKHLEQSYFGLNPKRKLFEQRNKLYQLFHHLNHWDHFGSGYRPSSLKLLKDLNSAKTV